MLLVVGMLKLWIMVMDYSVTYRLQINSFCELVE